MSAGATQSLAMAFGVGALISALCTRLRIPAVVPLLLAGVAVGRSGLGLVDLDTLRSVFPAVIATSIGLLVFEGGLHLRREELARAPIAVLGLLTIGVLVTWLGITALAVFVLGFDWPIGLVLGSVLIVTGPTVVQPILRHVRLRKSLNVALSAEAILIDPIGVIVAVSCTEFALAYYRGAFEGSMGQIALHFGLPFVSGFLVGAAAGVIGSLLLKLLGGRQRAEGTMNVAATAICMLTIGAGEMVAPEGGLVAATVAAVILSNLHVLATSDVQRFKQQISTLLVGMLFVLLASDFEISRLMALGPEHLLFVVLLLLVIRPLNVLFGTIGSKLPLAERGYAALFAPRGIVAASVAALSAHELVDAFGKTADLENVAALTLQAADLDLIVFLVIGVSVAWAAIMARPMGWALGVLAGPPRGVLIIGAHLLGRETAKVLRAKDVPVHLLDSNPRRVELATRDALPVVRGDATDTDLLNDLAREHETGWVLAWTGNDDVDKIIVRWAAASMGPDQVSTRLPALPPELRGTEKRPSTLRQLETMLNDSSVSVQLKPGMVQDQTILSLREDHPVRIGPVAEPKEGDESVALVVGPVQAPPPEPS